MTIDEAIAHAKEVASRKFDDRVHCIKCAEEHKQLAEWLEELKIYREFRDLIVFEARSDAIDEFVKECCEYEDLTFDKYAIQRIKSIAEQLKEQKNE